MADKSQIAPLVGIIMGSKSDWETMQPAADVLTQFGVPHECRIVSAHRTPDWMCQYAQEAEGRGLAVIIAGAEEPLICREWSRHKVYFPF